MRVHFELSAWIAVIVALVGVAPATATLRAATQEVPSCTRSEPIGLLQPPPPGLTGDAVIAKLLVHNKLQKARLQQYSVVRKYEVRNTKGILAAQAIVRVDYRAPSVKTFQKISEKGSWVIRRLVFDRLILAETETASGSEHHDSAITTANYRFALLDEQDIGPYHCLVVAASPKRKDKYLFAGKIWIDDQDFAVVRIAGHPAEKLSFWIRRVDFVRQYQKIEGFWLPCRDETFVDIRLYGKRILTIDHQDYSIEHKNAPGSSGSSGEFTLQDEPRVTRAPANSVVNRAAENQVRKTRTFGLMRPLAALLFCNTRCPGCRPDVGG